MLFWDILRSLLNDYGRFHICLLLILFFSQIRINNNFFSYSITAKEPVIRCVSSEEMDILVSYRSGVNVTKSDLKENNLPQFFYVLQNSSAPNQCPRVYSNNLTDCENWIYDVGESGFTITVEYGLCFDQLNRLYNHQAVLLFGSALGWFIGLIIGNFVGRRNMLLIALATDSLYSLITPFCGNMTSYIIMKFFTVIASGTMMAMLSLYVTEILPKHQRSIFNFLSLNFFSFGFIPLAILAALSRNWYHLEAATCFINCVITGLVLFLLPESPKWLFLEGKNKKARDALNWMYALHVNFKQQDDTQNYNNVPVEMVRERRWDAFDYLFVTLELSRQTLLLLILWSIHLGCYLFFTLNTTLLSGDPALSLMGFTFTELPISIIFYIFRNNFAQKSALLGVTILPTILLFILCFVVTFAENQGGAVTNILIYIIRLCSWICLQVLPRYGGLIYRPDTLHIRRAFFEMLPRFLIVIGALILIASFPVKFCYILTAAMLVNCIVLGFLPSFKPTINTGNEKEKSLTMR